MPASMPACDVADLTGLAVQALVEPEPDLLAVLLGHAEHPRDDLAGEQRREVLDDVESGRVELAEVVADDLAHHRLEAS